MTSAPVESIEDWLVQGNARRADVDRAQTSPAFRAVDVEQSTSVRTQYHCKPTTSAWADIGFWDERPMYVNGRIARISVVVREKDNSSERVEESLVATGEQRGSVVLSSTPAARQLIVVLAMSKSGMRNMSVSQPSLC
jgi:hypothetical protein